MSQITSKEIRESLEHEHLPEKLGKAISDLVEPDVEELITTDPKDPDYEDNEEDITIVDDGNEDETDTKDDTESSELESVRPRKTFVDKYHSDIESLASFKVEIETLTNTYFKDKNANTFIEAVGELNAPQFHNQVVKVFLWTILVQDYKQVNYKDVLPLARDLLDEIQKQKLLKKEEFHSAYRRLFYHLNELQRSNERAYDVLIDFAEYSLDNDQIDTDFFKQIKIQTEFSKDANRVHRLKSNIKTIIDEFFSSGDINEIITCINEMAIPFYTHEVVKLIISRALDADARCRDLTSKFLALAIGDGENDCIHRDCANLGFLILLQRVEELYKDVPDVIEWLSCFLSRCIVDECISPSFLDKVHLLETDMGYAVIHHSKNLLKGGLKARERLLNIWGVSSNKPIKILKKEIHDILKTFLETNELDETIESIKDLNVKNFHHEIIKQIIPLTPDMSNDNNKAQMCRNVAELINTCIDNNIIAIAQVQKGFKRIRDRIDDLKLDIPHIEWFYNKIAVEIEDVPLCGASK